MAGGRSDDEIGLADTASSPQPPAATPAAPVTQADSSASAALGHRPDADKLARAVARARVAEMLFAKKEQVKLGRYHLLEVVGAGGMGVVWGAWDPELDRRVAIKLVKATIPAARDRILAEGQALAKLSHPNVVPVYDVGVVDDEIYIVMEWVRGKTLRAYCREPRTVREILAIYRAAGEGLSAAHHAGMIHRDFKPDNAILGDDGRVRVLDFGLARGEVRSAADRDPVVANTASPSPELTRGAGTPRYMPPEQAEGRDLTPAVDQYAFGVSLREALAGRAGRGAGEPADLPRWLDEITTRSIARDPAARYESMDALVRALARDPRSVWRRRLVLVAALGATGAAFAVGTLRGGGDEVERCGGGKDEIARTWSAATRSELAAHLRSLGLYGAQEAQRLDGELASYSAGWAEAHRSACMAQQRGELTTQLYERSLGCLSRARAALDTVVDVLTTVEVSRLPDAVVAARGLPDAERCAIEIQTSTVEPPPPGIAAAAAEVANEIERARIVAIAQRPTAVAVANAAVARAEQLGYRPLVARAQLVRGLSSLVGNPADAVAPLQRATSGAFEVGDYATAVEAYAREIFAIAVSDKDALPAGVVDAFGAIPVAEAIAKGFGQRGAFARALLYNNVGSVRFTLGDREGARSWYQRAVEASETVVVNRYELAQVWGNLALVTERRDDRDRLVAKGRAALDRELGPDHPWTLFARIDAAWVVEDPQRSLATLREPCEALRRFHPHLRERVDECTYELGWMFEQRGRAAEARSAFSQITDESLRSIGAGVVLVLDGKLAEAARALLPIADDLATKQGFWLQLRSADARLMVGMSELGLGRRTVAIDQLDRTLATLNGTAAVVGTTASYQRRRARVEVLLARALAPADRATAANHAAAAAAWFRTAGGYDTELAEMTAIITGSP